MMKTNAKRLVTTLTYSEVNPKLSPDTRRMMRDERIAVQAAIDSGDQGKIRIASDEAIRVAEMWGVLPA